MEILIVGSGTMGRWFGECMAPTHGVTFTDADPEVAARAAAAVEGAVASPPQRDRFELVCLAVPIGAVGEAIERHGPKAERALVDVSGVMATPLAEMRAVGPELERVSFHPLFAPANEPGNVALVGENTGETGEAVRQAIEARGNQVFQTTAETHDRAMETVQARAHAAVLAYALAREDVPEQFQTPLSGPLSALVEQLSGNTPRVYADIQATFPGAQAVAEAAARIAAAAESPAAFASLYAEATGLDDDPSESGDDPG
jgi:prephenate dehydrogenase